jgi:outer membrane protein OmpA-like peptidoglycan-associated protein
MIRLRYLSICLVLCYAAGCSKTTVILLPDEQGSTGAVIVATEADSKTIDTPYHAATISGSATEAITVQPIEQDTVNKTYGELLQALPARSLNFTLYFIRGSSELAETSKQEVQNIIRQIKKTEPPVVLNIIGHTDATGSKTYNNQLSMDRARAVEAILRSSGSPIEIIRIQSFGENDPLIPTPDGVPEPKNRRVEVMVL